MRDRREQVMLYGLSSMEAGFYFESLVLNRTNNTIVIVDHNNKKVFVEPTDGSRDNTVQVSVRCHNGARREWCKKENQTKELPIESTKITIPGELIETSAHIVPELDCIITTPDIAQSILHPKTNRVNQERIREVLQNYVAGKEGIYVHYLVNDPMDRVSQIFGAFNNSRTFALDVTSLPLSEKNHATITITASASGRDYIVEIIDIENLFENSCLNIDIGANISLGLTADDAMKAVSMRRKEYELIVFDQVTKRMSEERKEYKETIDKMRSDHKEELRRTTQEFEIKLREGDHWKAVYAAQHGVQDFHMKRFEAEERMQKAKLATATETTKYVHTVTKIAGGVILGVIVPWFYKQIKSKE